jgi:hypothetical protein
LEKGQKMNSKGEDLESSQQRLVVVDIKPANGDWNAKSNQVSFSPIINADRSIDYAIEQNQSPASTYR